MSSPLVHTVVLTWNGSSATAACLASLAAQTHKANRLLLVDNGSATPPPPPPPPGRLICLKENRGFAGGVNAGIAAALADGAEYVWLLNDDAVAPPGTLAALVAAAEADPRLGILSPVIRASAERASFTAGRIDLPTLTFHYADTAEVAARWAADSPERLWVPGTAMLLRRALLERIGGFDATLFAYWEDNEICLRANRAGFRCAMVAEAEIFHPAELPGAGAAHRPPYFHYFMARNQLLLLCRHARWPGRARPLLWSLLASAREVARYRAHPALQRAIRQGIWDGLRGRGGAYVPAGPMAPRLGQLCLALAALAGRKASSA
ncbi:MAG: glycosyltransferase family 2 protein [Acetobacteraceae bacterium]